MKHVYNRVGQHTYTHCVVVDSTLDGKILYVQDILTGDREWVHCDGVVEHLPLYAIVEDNPHCLEWHLTAPDYHQQTQSGMRLSR